jgi:DNA processing protein
MHFDFEREFFACLALKHTRCVGPAVWKQLFGIFSSAYDAVQNADSWLSLGVESKFIKSISIKCKSEAWRDKAEDEFKATRQAGMDVVTWFDPRYPDKLRDLSDPPAILYVQGDTTLLKNPGVAVVGARECTALGLQSAGRIASQLANIGITVVSGLALGIDRQAHLGGLRGLGSSIAVLGCGLDIDYPYDNYDVRQALNKSGLVVTEFGPGVGPRAGHFPVRNRLISGLSLGVLVAEAAQNSGSLITARLAGEQGRDVFALPGPLGQPTFTGCHRLIKQGAALVETAEDIVEILRYDFTRELAGIPDPEPVKTEDEIDTDAVKVKEKKKWQSSKHKASSQPKEKNESERITRKRPLAVEREKIQLNGEEKQIMAMLEKAEKVHIDTLGRELEWPSAKVSKTLILLEMRGAVQQLPGMWYLAKEA